MKHLKIKLMCLLLTCFTFSQERKELLSLNGEWEIYYDENNEGKINKYHTIGGFEKLKSEKIIVPSGWEEFKKITKVWFTIKRILR